MVPATPAAHRHSAAMGPTMKSGTEMMEAVMAKTTVIKAAKAIVMGAVGSAEAIHDED